MSDYNGGARSNVRALAQQLQSSLEKTPTTAPTVKPKPKSLSAASGGDEQKPKPPLKPVLPSKSEATKDQDNTVKQRNNEPAGNPSKPFPKKPRLPNKPSAPLNEHRNRFLTNVQNQKQNLNDDDKETLASSKQQLLQQRAREAKNNKESDDDNNPSQRALKLVVNNEQCAKQDKRDSTSSSLSSPPPLPPAQANKPSITSSSSPLQATNAHQKDKHSSLNENPVSSVRPALELLLATGRAPGTGVMTDGSGKKKTSISSHHKGQKTTTEYLEPDFCQQQPVNKRKPNLLKTKGKKALPPAPTEQTCVSKARRYRRCVIPTESVLGPAPTKPHRPDFIKLPIQRRRLPSLPPGEEEIFHVDDFYHDTETLSPPTIPDMTVEEEAELDHQQLLKCHAVNQWKNEVEGEEEENYNDVLPAQSIHHQEENIVYEPMDSYIAQEEEEEEEEMTIEERFMKQYSKGTKAKAKKDWKKLMKKFNLSGKENILNMGYIMEYHKGADSSDLTVLQDDVVYVIRLLNNPPGKWLAQSKDGKIGYVDTSYIEVRADTIRRRMLLCPASSPGSCSSLLCALRADDITLPQPVRTLQPLIHVNDITVKIPVSPNPRLVLGATQSAAACTNSCTGCSLSDSHHHNHHNHHHQQSLHNNTPDTNHSDLEMEKTGAKSPPNNVNFDELTTEESNRNCEATRTRRVELEDSSSSSDTTTRSGSPDSKKQQEITERTHSDSPILSTAVDILTNNGGDVKQEPAGTTDNNSNNKAGDLNGNSLFSANKSREVATEEKSEHALQDDIKHVKGKNLTTIINILHEKPVIKLPPPPRPPRCQRR